MRRRIVNVYRSGSLLLALALAGCVSLTPQQQAQVDEIQRFADRTPDPTCIACRVSGFRPSRGRT